MNRKTLFLILCVFVANMQFTVSVGTVYATSCFTDTGGS